jgi:hypothetical protein
MAQGFRATFGLGEDEDDVRGVDYARLTAELAGGREIAQK